MAEYDEIHARLAPFLENNRDANIEQRGRFCVITSPWADPTFVVVVASTEHALVDALNAVQLPPRFSALWHRDSKDLEFIYTPAPVDPNLRSRSFAFGSQGRTFQCEFGSASDRLLLIADAIRPIAPSPATEYRNLLAFQVFMRCRKRVLDLDNELAVEPTSFWIRNVDIAEIDVVGLARSLNFYMHYFDHHTPRIILHEEPQERAPTSDPIRYPHGPFPTSISGRQLDPYLLGLWETSASGEPLRRFLYSYQIIEYVAYYYMKEAALHTVKRILASPATPVQINEAARQIHEAVVANQSIGEPDKIKAVVKQLVDPTVIWKEIEPNLDYFCSEVKFDGGFTLSALLSKRCDLDDFQVVWNSGSFPDTLRHLRNALVHSREARMGGVIAPTRANYDLLRPWLGPLSVTAMQVVACWEA